MESTLIVSTTAKSLSFLTEILRQIGVTKVFNVNSALEARRRLIDFEYDLCIINAPLGDETGEKLAISIAQKGFCQVILIAKAEFADAIGEKVEDYGVITLGKPLSKDTLWNALKITSATFKKMKRMQKENKKLLERIEDIRVITRAKCILVSYLSMTEEEAHRYIEKQAMDMRITRREVAEEVLKTYEN